MFYNCAFRALPITKGISTQNLEANIDAERKVKSTMVVNDFIFLNKLASWVATLNQTGWPLPTQHVRWNGVVTRKSSSIYSRLQSLDWLQILIVRNTIFPKHSYIWDLSNSARLDIWQIPKSLFLSQSPPFLMKLEARRMSLAFPRLKSIDIWSPPDHWSIIGGLKKRLARCWGGKGLWRGWVG